VGVVFSEWSLTDPAAWDFIRPILLENGGWAIFNYTPRGRNHGYALYEMARKNPNWFCQLLTAKDTGIITPEMIAEERASGMDDDMIEQEYYCSWMGVRQGAIYGQQMKALRERGGIRELPYLRRYPVQTFWDIGHSDTTAIICHQDVDGFDNFINGHEESGQDVPYFVHWLKETGYLFGKHYLPHDAKNVVLASKSNPLGANVFDQLVSCGINPNDIEIVPRTPDKWTAITATRARVDTVRLDETRCSNFISALESYHKKWDDKRKCYSNDPVHDWSSNYADAFRQWAQGYKGQQTGMRFSAPQQITGSGRPGRVTLPTNIRTVGNRRVGY
jgi:hypothetical protein